MNIALLLVRRHNNGASFSLAECF